MEAATATAPGRLAAPGTALNRLRADRRLAERFRAGDDNAFAVLHERHRHRLLAVCIGVLGSYEDAQDALQNALVSAAASLRQSTPDDLRAWLARIARNAAIDLARARRPVTALYDDAPDRDGGPPARAQAREDMEQLVASLRRLPEHQRTALVMRELAGCSYAEIGEALEVDEAAVRGLIARARLSLRAELEASELACATVREDIAHQPDARRRRAIVRRHLRACDGCKEFDLALRADARALRGLAPSAGGFGLVGLASLLRLTRPLTLGGVVAQGVAGTQVLKAVAVCAVCVTAASGVTELTVERPPSRAQPAGARQADASPARARAAGSGATPTRRTTAVATPATPRRLRAAQDEPFDEHLGPPGWAGFDGTRNRRLRAERRPGGDLAARGEGEGARRFGDRSASGRSPAGPTAGARGGGQDGVPAPDGTAPVGVGAGSGGGDSLAGDPYRTSTDGGDLSPTGAAGDGPDAYRPPADVTSAPTGPTPADGTLGG